MRDIRLWGGVLLVSGTTIGAAMLALPIVTGFAGFIPSLALLLLFWLYMTFTAFLFLEVNLWMGPNTNLITMARQTLGKTGQAASWVVYLFLLYTLTTAYMAGSGPIFIDFVQHLTGWIIAAWAGPLPLLLLFGFFVYKGARFVDYANRVLMSGLAISFIAMVFFLSPYIELPKLERHDWSAIWVAVSVISTSFGFHIIIPTLTDYLDRDVTKLRKVIWIGSSIPLVVYLIWELIALGIIPQHGEIGLIKGYQQGLDGATLMSQYLMKAEISQISAFFSLFAIVTSFLGVSLSLRDFLADGLKIGKNTRGRLLLYFLTFGPPLLLTLTDPRAFLNALEYAGAFGVVTLLGVLPVLMVWRGRYVQCRPSLFTVRGGKVPLLLTLLLSIAVIGLEIANKSGFRLPTTITNEPRVNHE